MSDHSYDLLRRAVATSREIRAERDPKRRAELLEREEMQLPDMGALSASVDAISAGSVSPMTYLDASGT